MNENSLSQTAEHPSFMLDAALARCRFVFVKKADSCLKF
jgi:hypothetical protein